MRRTAGTTFQIGQLVAVGGAATFHARLVAPDRYDLLHSERAGWWVVVTLVLGAGGYGLGLPELPAGRFQAAARSLVAFGLAIGVVSMAQMVLAAPLLPRSSLGLLAFIVPLWAVIGWDLAGDVANWQSLRDRVFVVAEQPEEPAALRFELSRRPETPAAVVGSMSIEQARLGPDGRARLVEAAERVGASVLVLDTGAQSDDGIVQQAALLHHRGLRIRTLALFYEGWLGKLPVAELARVSLLFDIGELHRLRYVRSKRIVDLALGLAGVPLLAVVAVVAGVGNRFANQGPLLFRQLRVGKDGAVFTIYKFRTMAPEATVGRGSSTDGPSSPWTAHDDCRITPFGRFLRRTHLDELPQVVNVLRGELSIVGPRPEQLHYVEELRDKIAFYDVRHLVRPGLTGWAQVKQGYAADDADALEKLQYDFFYLRRQGLALDVRIIWRTARDVIGAGGR